MNQEIKDKLEQAAKDYIDKWPVKFTAAESSAFIEGAQTILDNPAEWGLCSLEVLEATSVSVGKAWVDNERLQSQLAKYRNALESIVNTSTIDAVAFPLQTVSEFYSIAKEALKKEDIK